MAANNTSRQVHNILTIPPEITERIAEVANPKDLLNLRLVCKEADARVLRTYGRVHFRTVGVLLCAAESVDRLLEIAASEKLSAFVKYIDLFVAGIPDPESDKLRLVERRAAGPMAKAHAVNMDLLSSSQSQRLEEKHSLQRSTASNKTRYHTLIVALSRLRQRRIQPIFDLVDLGAIGSHKSSDGRRPPFYYRALRAEIDVELEVTMSVVRAQSRCFFDAVALSGLQIEELKSHILSKGLPIFDHARHGPTFQAISTVFSGLRWLDISITSPKNAAAEDSDRLAQMLSSMPHLEQLKLAGHWKVPEPCLGEPLFRQRFEGLFALWLMNFEFAYDGLCKFCRLQPKLQFVSLDSCSVTLDEGLNDVAQLSRVKVARDLERRGRIGEATLSACRVGGEYDSQEESGGQDDEDDEEEENSDDTESEILRH